MFISKYFSFFTAGAIALVTAGAISCNSSDDGANAVNLDSTAKGQGQTQNQGQSQDAAQDDTGGTSTDDGTGTSTDNGSNGGSTSLPDGLYVALMRPLNQTLYSNTGATSTSGNNDNGNTNTPTTSASASPSPSASASGGVTTDLGRIEFEIRQGRLFVREDVNGLPVGIHIQHVHTGATCPTATADTNGDSVIDAVEEAAVSGGILIPLDGNLNSQAAGNGVYPRTSSSGRLVYNRSTSVASMLADLNGTLGPSASPSASASAGINAGASPSASVTATASPSPSASAGVGGSSTPVKLNGAPLDLANRVVVVHGISALNQGTSIPTTAQTLPGLTVQESIPVACGEIDVQSQQP